MINMFTEDFAYKQAADRKVQFKKAQAMQAIVLRNSRGEDTEADSLDLCSHWSYGTLAAFLAVANRIIDTYPQ